MTSASALRVRDLDRADLRAVMRIDAAAYPDPWSRRLWVNELARANRIYLAAERGDQVVGYAGALLAVDDAHVTTIATAPDHLRSGVATVLLASLVRRAVSSGASALTLEVRATNTAAQQLYRRFGMEVAGVRRNYYQSDNEDAFVMWAHDIDNPQYQVRIDELMPVPTVVGS